MPDSQVKIVRGEIMPPEAGPLRMPAGTPFGVAILGAMKFSAVRRVIEQYELALRAKAAAIDAEGAVANAIVRREVARVQLEHLDTIRENEANRITELATIAKLRRELERMELEDQVAERKTRREAGRESVNRKADNGRGETAGAQPDEFAAFIENLRKLPNIVKAAGDARAQIVKDAGGEEKLTEAQRQACELLDAMMQSFVSKKAGDAAL